MRNNVLRKVIIGIVACITLFALFVVYLAYNWNVKERDTYYITATDGKKFKMSYELLSARPGCRIWLNYRGDKARIVVPSKQTSKDVDMFFLYENDDFSYYRILYGMGNSETNGKTLAILSKKERINILPVSDAPSYVKCTSEGKVIRGVAINEVIPLAEYEILANKNADYIMLYADYVYNSNGRQLIEVLKSFVENPDSVKSEYYTKEEILAKCDELLQKYGDVQ